MMAQKHLLHELLKEDQEPFFLNTYISDKLTQLKIIPNNHNNSPSSSSKFSHIHLQQLNKQKQQQPIIQQNTKNLPLINLCKNLCFLSSSLPNTTSSPDFIKSPLFQFSSPPPKSPCSSPNTIFLEVAAKIQKHSEIKTLSKSHNKFGLYLSSFFKRQTKQEGWNSKKGELVEYNNKSKNAKVKDIMTFDSFINRKKASNGKLKEQEHIIIEDGVCLCEVGFTCSSCNGSGSNAVWSSESKQDDNKYLDMEILSTSYDPADYEEKNENTNGAFYSESPFRFVLQRSPSAASGCQTPDFSSPSCRRTEDNECDGDDNLKKFQSSEEEEEEKEQCSPVSVLDPPFEGIFEDDGEYDHENDDEEDDFDSECNYANVQRATQQLLLYKLHKYDKFSELDPLNLEKRMLDQEEDEYDDSETSSEDKELRELVFEILSHSRVHDNNLQVPEDLNRLVYDLIMEEERELNSSKDKDMVISKVCRRLEMWNEVECDTIHMMIEDDLSREQYGWKKNAEQIRELAGELELAIFEFLVMEFSKELLC